MGKKVTQGNIGRTPGENARVRRAFQRLSKSRQNLIGGGGLEELPNGGLGITDGGVTTSKLADGSVTTPKLADDAVTEAKLADDSVTTAKLVDDSVTTPKIVDSAVTTPKLADASVTETKLADDSVTSNKLVDSSVTTAKLADGSVTEAKLADGSVTEAKLADGSVTTPKLANDAVTTAKLADGSVTAPKLATDSVETAKIVDGAVTEAKLGALAVATGKIADLAVTAVKIAANAVTLGKLGALTTKGDVLTHDGTSHKRLGVGTNTQVLQADSSQTNGIKWTDFTLGNLSNVNAPGTGLLNVIRSDGVGGWNDGFVLKANAYAPVFFNQVNISFMENREHRYLITGSLVQVFGRVGVTTVAGNLATPVETAFALTLPVLPTNVFTEGFQAAGWIAGAPADYNGLVNARTTAVPGTKTVRVQYMTVFTGPQAVFYSFAYWLNN